MNGSFPGFCSEYITFDTKNITNIGEVFPQFIVTAFIFTRTNIIPLNIDLDSA